MPMSKMEIARDLEDQGLGRARQIANILTGLAELASEQIAQGEDFTVPGLVKISWRYTRPRKKGEQYKKGDTYIGFGGVEQVAEADSKARKASVKLAASPAAAIKSHAPRSRDDTSMADFLRGKVGKKIAAAKGR